MTVNTQSPDRFVSVDPTDALARPLLEELAAEYDTRYGDFFGEPASVELNRYPAENFSAPDGTFLLLLREGTPIAGGAFQRFDDSTAELKRIWTSSTHRREGLARRVVTELEAEAIRRGYARVYLTTGPRQPEAVALYIAAGYTPEFDVTLPPEEVGIHAFTKQLRTDD
ncbi:GNAT family N-acetyltransferase [Leifsonia poae]|uniref:GNAT family N-acetyltransferase n=1 Tax=Leifsonia poae TaxID=110933 RepID=UPI001CBCF6D9|nr:GNAT family N-acetyltransferase [Leifsonia poae]